MATFRYPIYEKNVTDGTINPLDVNFSAYIVDDTYKPAAQDTKAKVTGRIETLVKILIGGDISTLTMSQIIDKVKSKLSDEEYEQATAFVVYDIATADLCWHETFDKPIIEQ
jgi:hypothetical protein